jgi:hypothetical protein
MSVETIALVEHHLNPRDIQVLPARLLTKDILAAVEALCDAYEADNPSSPARMRPFGWTMATAASSGGTTPEAAWREGEPILIDGANECELALGPRICQIRFPYRWTRFLSDARYLSSIRQLASEVAKLLGSPLIIYVPESAYVVREHVLDALSIAELASRLLQAWGLPASNPAEIAQPASRGKGYLYEVKPHGYLVERTPLP